MNWGLHAVPRSPQFTIHNSKFIIHNCRSASSRDVAVGEPLDLGDREEGAGGGGGVGAGLPDGVADAEAVLVGEPAALEEEVDAARVAIAIVADGFRAATFGDSSSMGILNYEF